MLIKPKTIDCTVTVPYSKSEFLRACLISMLRGNSEIHNISKSSDAQAGLAILQKFSNYNLYENKIIISKSKTNENYFFDCNESAFLARSLTAIAVLMKWDAIISGSGTLAKRNLSDVYSFLQCNEIHFDGKAPNLPIRIYPKQNLEKINIEGEQSSQLLSGALIGNAFLDKPTLLNCKNFISKGYIRLTLDMLQKAGIEYDYNGFSFVVIHKDISKIVKFEISGDWSAAAFAIVAGLVAGKTVIKNLSPRSVQPDSIILDFVKKLGANINEKADGNGYEIFCEKSEIPAFEIDLTDNPDLIPPLVVLALNANGISKIKGVQRLINKESDRKNAILEEFARIGARINCLDDSFIIEGKAKLNGGNASTHNDHRIAMALAIAVLNSKSGIVLDNPACVSKSFPNFWDIFS